jgi:hypothetical protein
MDIFSLMKNMGVRNLIQQSKLDTFIFKENKRDGEDKRKCI